MGFSYVVECTVCGIVTSHVQIPIESKCDITEHSRTDFAPKIDGDLWLHFKENGPTEVKVFIHSTLTTP